MEPEKSTLAQFERSPLASENERIAASYALSEGPVRFLLVSGELGRRTLGPGRRVLALDRRGARWVLRLAAVALARQRDGAELQERAGRAAGPPSDIYAYWQGQVGIAGSFMIDPQQHADTLFQVARRVGAL